MSTVFTGESKIFQLAAINFDARSKTVPQVSRNVPLICKLMDDGFELTKMVMNCEDVQEIAKFVVALSFDIDQLTNTFLEEMERSGMTWGEAHAHWVSYHESVQLSLQQDAINRLSKLN